MFFPEEQESLLARKRSSLDMAMTLSMAQSITFAASEEENKNKPEHNETADIFDNIKQLTAR